ncbi:hypothetical protein [Maribacter sp. MMG018]|nr:hypothetical protein [Maribacter sp. MMG018]
MKTVKKKILDLIRFLCMVVVLGLQNLVTGSWTTENQNQKTA